MCASECCGNGIKSMANCLKCNASVSEEKAFCPNCGSPMNPSMAQHEQELPDFSATMIELPKKSARPSSPPMQPPLSSAVQPSLSPTQMPAPPAQSTPPPVMTSPSPIKEVAAPVSRPASTALPTQADAQTSGGKSNVAKFGLGFVVLLLILIFAAFVLSYLLS